MSRITPTMERLRDTTSYIEGSVHYNRRAYDKQFEVVARLTDPALEKLGSSIGGEIVLDVQPNRHAALESVRFFRRQETKNEG